MAPRPRAGTPSSPVQPQQAPVTCVCLIEGCFFTKRRQNPHAVGPQCADIIPIYGLILENLTSRASHGTITGKNRGAAHVSFPHSTLSKFGLADDAARRPAPKGLRRAEAIC